MNPICGESILGVKSSSGHMCNFDPVLIPPPEPLSPHPLTPAPHLAPPAARCEDV
jgi:hypothetical protein